MTDKPIGHFERSMGTRYWVGGCTCGSGKEGRELCDARGIYCGITCDGCRKEDGYRQDVMTNPAYEADEPIEED